MKKQYVLADAFLVSTTMPLSPSDEVFSMFEIEQSIHESGRLFRTRSVLSQLVNSNNTYTPTSSCF